MSSHVYLANSEKQAIWTRHATMIVANSVLINGAWSKTPATVAPWLNLFGFFLRLVWGVMTWFYKTIKYGKSICVNRSIHLPTLQSASAARTPYSSALYLLLCTLSDYGRAFG